RSELLRYLKRAREHGYAWQIECSAPGMAAMAALVRHPEDGRALGVLSVAGPSARFGEARMHELAPLLLAAAQDLSHASQASELFR
ncbi:IclR family transcriptional regulator, partial [Pseudomonas aeruginosa]|nr:IclR family transcriptional regulator [Pseudomonas aeruginosa]